jgi:hypothetical protein
MTCPVDFSFKIELRCYASTCLRFTCLEDYLASEKDLTKKQRPEHVAAVANRESFFAAALRSF